MSGLWRFARRYPLVVVTLLVLAAAIVFAASGSDVIAAWGATIYVGGIVVWTAIGMVRDMLRGSFGLDILAVIAMVASLAVGEYLAALIIVLMLTGGEALEDFAANRAKRELTALLDRAPSRAHRFADGDREGSVDEVPVDALVPGDLVLVKPAEIVPVDGTLEEGEGAFDESSLTGESLPVTKAIGDAVMSGSLNGPQAVLLRATASAADSQYQRIIALVHDAEQQKAPAVRLADRFSVPFTLVSLAIAGVAWWLSGDPVRFAEVLVLATPCPLLIAAPVAFLGGMSRSAKSGVVVKSGATLEGLARAKSVAFDKTGTLTRGRPEVTRIETAAGIDPDELLRLAASAEQYSSHVLATGILHAAHERGLAPAPGTDVTEVATNGVVATIEGRRVAVGKLAFIRAEDATAPDVTFAAGETAVHIALDGRRAGALIVADGLRENARATVEALRADGIAHVAMLTGDNRATAASLSAQAGITEVHAELLPADKVRLLAAMPHRPVIMVGDGVNDAPVLAAADVGIAMGARGSTAASESADVVILRDDIGAVAQAVTIGRHTFSVALTAIWIGVVLSVGLMLVAAFGFIPAVAGALTQELVDLACILYALRALGGPIRHGVELGDARIDGPRPDVPQVRDSGGGDGGDRSRGGH